MFNPETATDMTRYIIRQLGGGTVERLKMMKLLYLTERKSLLEHGIPMCSGKIVAMDNGPVLQGVYDLVNAKGKNPYWTSHIAYTQQDGYSALPDGDFDYLSEHDRSMLDAVISEHGNKSPEELVAYTHELVEYVGAVKGKEIKLGSLLTKNKWSKEDAAEVVQRVEEEDSIAGYLNTL